MSIKVIRNFVADPVARWRDYGQIVTVAVHRTGWHTRALFDQHGYEPHPDSLARMYAKEAGIRVWPYTFTVGWEGQVWQSHLLETVTPHACAFNVRALGVAVIGDFRFARCTTAQYASLVELLALIKRWHPVRLKGHSPELGPSATNDPTKLCPGPLLDMDELRRDVIDMINVLGTDELRSAGVAV